MKTWEIGVEHECPFRADPHTADAECVRYALEHGDRTYVGLGSFRRAKAKPVVRVRLDGEDMHVVPEPVKPDLVNHPPHYTGGPPCPGCGRTIECIDITRWLSFNSGNTVKYIWRRFFGRKDGDGSIQGLRKGRWYLDNEIDRLDSEATP